MGKTINHPQQLKLSPEDRLSLLAELLLEIISEEEPEAINV